jgi:hypothetical protein
MNDQTELLYSMPTSFLDFFLSILLSYFVVVIVGHRPFSFAVKYIVTNNKKDQHRYSLVTNEERKKKLVKWYCYN